MLVSPSTAESCLTPMSLKRPQGAVGSGRYSPENAAHISPGPTSPPSESVTCWTTWENSIWSRRGRSSLCSVRMM